MREILFRGKRLDNGQWIEGWIINRTYPAIKTTLCYIVTKGRSLIIDKSYPVDPSTAGQYTGFTDKNGRKVFEGDICQIKNNRLIDDNPFVIAWNGEEYNGWVWHDLDEGYGMDSFGNGVAKICEVIGNIHDNPEFLEANNENH